MNENARTEFRLSKGGSETLFSLSVQRDVNREKLNFTLIDEHFVINVKV